LQKSIICSNSRPEKNLTPQLPVGNEEFKFFDNTEVGHRIGLFGMFFEYCNGLNFLLPFHIRILFNLFFLKT